jgi:hypothetical protein
LKLFKKTIFGGVIVGADRDPPILMISLLKQALAIVLGGVNLSSRSTAGEFEQTVGRTVRHAGCLGFIGTVGVQHASTLTRLITAAQCRSKIEKALSPPFRNVTR